ncbi:MAG TPA: DUF2061 domain-containing protein [Crenalkalicoccus sp.]|jgi:uncharacterized membrane protein|nr:DUF2061 domain-containing protein [Crenalkalicoccus sp.]
MAESHARSIAKAVSWRATGTVDTFILSWLITGRVALAGSIAGTEVLTKITLFYLHERAWARIPWGRNAVEQPAAATHAAPATQDVAGAAVALR